MNYDPKDPDKMDLPAGVKCGDCAHMPRCKAIFGHVESDTRCDWSPSRYYPSRATAYWNAEMDTLTGANK